MDLQQVRQELEQNKAILIDVREQDEWNAAHISSARLLPLSELEEDIPSDLPTDKILYIHCRRGGRAERAAEILQEAYTNEMIPLKYPFEKLKQELAP